VRASSERVRRQDRWRDWSCEKLTSAMGKGFEAKAWRRICTTLALEKCDWGLIRHKFIRASRKVMDNDDEQSSFDRQALASVFPPSTRLDCVSFFAPFASRAFL
jgi:hypothetical protein